MEGAAPEGPGQFAIDTTTADRGDFLVGETYQIIGVDGPEPFELVGITRFGEENALGRVVRVADFRLRVIGVMEPKGRMLGFDIDDSAYVPVAMAMRMFNTDELGEIDVGYLHEGWTDSVVEGIRQVLMDRHDGEEDFTLTTQTAMLDVFDNVLSVVTLAVGGIGGILGSSAQPKGVEPQGSGSGDYEVEIWFGSEDQLTQRGGRPSRRTRAR